MSAVVMRKVQTGFAKRAGSGRGVGLDEAVASAETRLESMGDGAREEIAAMLSDLQEHRRAVATREPAAMTAVRVQAEAIAGVAGVFGMPEVGQTAMSLCQLFDAASPGQPNADAVRVHLDAFRVFEALNPTQMLHAAPIVLAGLEDVVAAEHRRNHGLVDQ